MSQGEGGGVQFRKSRVRGNHQTEQSWGEGVASNLSPIPTPFPAAAFSGFLHVCSEALAGPGGEAEPTPPTVPGCGVVSGDPRLTTVSALSPSCGAHWDLTARECVPVAKPSDKNISFSEEMFYLLLFPT